MKHKDLWDFTIGFRKLHNYVTWAHFIFSTHIIILNKGYYVRIIILVFRFLSMIIITCDMCKREYFFNENKAIVMELTNMKLLFYYITKYSTRIKNFIILNIMWKISSYVKYLYIFRFSTIGVLSDVETWKE